MEKNNNKKKDMTLSLPDDALVCVLSRLAPRSLVASRCVCRAWRDVVDAHRLLRTDLLPLSLGGIYLHVSDCGFPPLFTCPSTVPTAMCNDLDYLETNDYHEVTHVSFWTIQDHCNGLLLFHKHVVNPATRQWAWLPYHDNFHHESYLAFDPTVSLHYEVVWIPQFYYQEGLEWPSSPYVMHVFSSRTRRWEERSFLREGPARGNDAPTYNHLKRYGVYWHGVLYVQCKDNFVMRINLSTGKYRLIEPPALGPHGGYGQLHLGKSEKGVYYGLISSQIQVWFLDESYGHIEWVLKWEKSIAPMKEFTNYDEHTNRPWHLQCYNSKDKYYENYVDNDVVHIIEDYNNNYVRENIPNFEGREVSNNAFGSNMEAFEEIFEWGSYNNESVAYNKERFFWYSGRLKFLGFHPYEETIFINDADERVMAYHLNSANIEDLGITVLKGNRLKDVEASFVYTPCPIDEVLENS